ncbi:MAG: hypothetical protein R3D28_25880 [Geminicoccaceae bacterium]
MPLRQPSQKNVWWMNPTRRRLYGLIGAGGFGREVMPLLDACVRGQGSLLPGGEAEVVFVESRPALPEVRGRPVLSLADFLEADGRERLFNVAIADSHIREDLAGACLDAGGLALTLVAGDAEIFPAVTIGDGRSSAGGRCDHRQRDDRPVLSLQHLFLCRA